MFGEGFKEKEEVEMARMDEGAHFFSYEEEKSIGMLDDLNYPKSSRQKLD